MARSSEAGSRSPSPADRSVTFAVSPWLGDVRDSEPPLRGEAQADVVVVGGGYTGLSTALAMRAEGRSVVLLESHVCGFGASGRNAGHLTPTIGKDVPTLLKLFGRERTGALVSLADTAIGEVERLMAEHAIDCDYEGVGNVIGAVHPDQYRAVDRAAEAAAALGLPGNVLEPDAMRRRGLPRAFLRGFHETHGGILHPGLYVRGLRRAALAAGVRIHENCPVLAVEDGPKPRARVRDGFASGEFLVVAVNAYSAGLPSPLPRSTDLLPLTVQLIQTEPLSPEQMARVDWRGREGVYTAHEVLESWRLTRDGRIVGGSKHVRYGYGGRALPDRDATVTLRLEAAFRQRFPELSDVEIPHVWGGRLGFALDFLPLVGRTGSHGRVLYSLAYAGHGIAMASYAGRMIGDLLAGRDGPGSALWKRRVLPLPPEPLRWLTFQGLNRFFEAVDLRVDRKVNAGR